MHRPPSPEWRYAKTVNIEQLKTTITAKEDYLGILTKELEAHKKELAKLESPKNSKLSILLFTTQKVDSEGIPLSHGTRSFYYLADVNKAIITTSAFKCTLDLSTVFATKQFETLDRDDDPREELQRRSEQRNRIFRETINSVKAVIDDIFAKNPNIKYWDELCTLVKEHYFR